MTWSREARVDSPKEEVGAMPVVFPGGDEKGVALRIGTKFAYLTEEDAASLGGYLLGITNNPEAETTGAHAAPEEPTDTVTEAPELPLPSEMVDDGMGNQLNTDQGGPV